MKRFSIVNNGYNIDEVNNFGGLTDEYRDAADGRFGSAQDRITNELSEHVLGKICILNTYGITKTVTEENVQKNEKVDN